MKRQNKILVTLSIAMAVLFTSPVFGLTTGNLLLSGTVPGILEISVTADPGANNLDLIVDQTDLAVATVNERSNKKAGYTVTLESANAAAAASSTAFFKSGDAGNSETLNYTMKYNGAAVTLSSGTALVTDSDIKTTGTGVSKPVTISYSGSAVFLTEDTYADTLTFTIAAK